MFDIFVYSKFLQIYEFLIEYSYVAVGKMMTTNYECSVKMFLKAFDFAKN